MQSNETTKPDGEKPKKTWKREIAFLLFIWLGYLVETKEPELVKILTFPIFTFGALSFGLQWYAPNGGLLRQSSQSSYRNPRSQYSSQRASREDQQPDSRDYQRHRAETSEAEGEEHQPDSRH